MDVSADPGAAGGAGRFVGELAVEADGALGAVAHGWCWNPLRPTLRGWVEILAEDWRVARVPARTIRDDLRDRGVGDGMYAFRAVVAAELLPCSAEILVRARVAGQRDAFGQRLLQRRLDEPAPRLEAARAALASLAARWPGPSAAAQDPYRAAFGALSQRLSPRGPLVLPLLRAPRWSLIAPLAGGLGAALARVQALAPLAWSVGCEVIAQLPDDQPELALLAGLVPNLVVGNGQATPRGRGVALLQARGGSTAVLTHLLRHAEGLVFGPPAPPTLPALTVPASPGVTVLGPAEWVTGADGWQSVMARAREARVACHRLVVA